MATDPKAQQRADLIIQVRSGKLPAAEAARQLGVSRKTYYKWEARALTALLQAVADRGEGGRPARERDAEKERLRERIVTLEEDVRDREQAERVRTILAEAKKK